MRRMKMLNEKSRSHINEIIEQKFGMTYEEFENLDFDVQQVLISNLKMTQKNFSMHKTPIGYGEHLTFIDTEKPNKKGFRK